MNDRKKKALVTGGGGYVGTRLCMALVQKGYEVTALDIHHQQEESSKTCQIKIVKVSSKKIS